jgi:hypothetical protein
MLSCLQSTDSQLHSWPILNAACHTEDMHGSGITAADLSRGITNISRRSKKLFLVTDYIHFYLPKHGREVNETKEENK